MEIAIKPFYRNLMTSHGGNCPLSVSFIFWTNVYINKSFTFNEPLKFKLRLQLTDLANLDTINGPRQTKKCLQACAKCADSRHPAHAQSFILAVLLSTETFFSIQ